MSTENKVQRAVIECLNRFYAIETGMWGDPVSCLIIRTVIKGRIEDRLYDLSSLSAYLDLSLSTVHRKVRKIEAAGYIRTERKGRSMVLLPTEKVQAVFNDRFDEMVETLRRLYGRDAATICAPFGKAP